MNVNHVCSTLLRVIRSDLGMINDMVQSVNRRRMIVTVGALMGKITYACLGRVQEGSN